MARRRSTCSCGLERQGENDEFRPLTPPGPNGTGRRSCHTARSDKLSAVTGGGSGPAGSVEAAEPVRPPHVAQADGALDPKSVSSVAQFVGLAPTRSHSAPLRRGLFLSGWPF